MRYFAETLFNHIREQVRHHLEDDLPDRRLLFMVSSIPAAAAAAAGSHLVDYCIEDERLATPIIQVSRELFAAWEAAPEAGDHPHLAGMMDRGWRDETGALTSYRHVPAGDRGLLLIVLIGVDRVTDASSLADFHRCDLDTLWQCDLSGSFATWIRAALGHSHVAFEEDTVAHFNEVLHALVDRGLADILQVSTLLENLDLNAAQDGRDAEGILLDSLGELGLPSFTGYRFSGRRSFGPYLQRAIDLFSYDQFLEEPTRKRALNAIDEFVRDNEPGDLFDERCRGAFQSEAEFISGLRDYVEYNDGDARERLLRCDFITISDEILGYKSPSPPRPKRETVKKLSGGPVEVVLAGLWRALGDFKKEAVRRGRFAHESLRSIEIRAYLFRHDCEGDTADERRSNARGYLARLLGGVDRLLEEQLESDRLCGAGAGPLVSRLINDEIQYQPSRTAEPCLEFQITLTSEELGSMDSRFAWRLPETQTYRVADEVFQWAEQSRSSAAGYWLPIFHVPYYQELMLAKDEEETRRILQQCIQSEADGAVNLLDAPDLDRTDPLFGRIRELSLAYGEFVGSTAASGLHGALSTAWDRLRKAYDSACEAYLNEDDCAGSALGAMLFRSFLIIGQHDDAEGQRWFWADYQPSAVVTVLHPALLEMLQAHLLYLLTCFVAVAEGELKTPGAAAFRDATWQNYVDLAAIHMPLFGLLKDRNRLLDTTIRGEELVHRLGTTPEQEATLTTRLLLRYDAWEDEDLSDAELFRQSREATLLRGILADYRRLHPHADDSLSLAVFTNRGIQPLIAAVDGFIKQLFGDRAEDNEAYSLSVTVFTESSDDASVARWISQWRERWQEAETQDSLEHYRRTRLSVAHRLVSAADYYRQFQRVIAEGLEADIAILDSFISAGTDGNDFAPVAPYDVTTRTLKFPILEKSFCSLRDPGKQLQRARVLSNRQFRIATQHAEVMARLKIGEASQATHHVVLGYGDYAPWQGVVDALHKRAEWVVCIDPSIDERLIARKNLAAEQAREIIGFGSGVGSHGEANYTISTEQFTLSDVLHRLQAAIGEIYTTWDSTTQAQVGKSILGEASRLSGLSLVRATGIGESVRDFMAYCLTRKMLAARDQTICDQIVSLDAYRHWFDSAESDTRPDLLWMVVRLNEDDRLCLDLRLIECKLAHMSPSHLDKARQQLENALEHLVSVFQPRRDGVGTEDERPDQRYWWLQLHRLIASKGEIAKQEERRVLAALERLAEGDYDIQWHAAALGFWTDQPNQGLVRTDTWPYQFEGQSLEIDVMAAGLGFVRALCVDQRSESLPWGESAIRFAAPPAALPVPETDVDPQVGVAGRPEHLIFTPDESARPDVASIPEATPAEEPSALATAVDVTAPKIERILIGTTPGGSRPVYWEFGHRDLSNRHLLLFGASGMGKTYTIQCLLCELGAAQHSSLIIDYTSGFFEAQLEPEFQERLCPLQHIVRMEPLAINPFRQQIDMIGGHEVPEGAANTAQRISGVFSEVYTLGDQQKSALYQAVKSGIGLHGMSDTPMTLEHLIQLLQEMVAEGGVSGTAAGSVISKLRPFIDQNPFGGENPKSWDRFFMDPQHRCHVLQLAGFQRTSSRLITEFSLYDLYWYYRSRGSRDEARVVVLDEVQNLDHREDSPLAQLLREGRKFGFSLILATQIMSNLQRDERDRLFNAAHKLFFRPADTELRTYAEIIATAVGDKADVWMPKLAKLRKGECYSLGPSLNQASGELEAKALKVTITPLGERLDNG